MRTSNKLLIAVGVLLLAYLVTYDLALKAEYDRGAYKSRFYKMTRINIKDFDVVQNDFGNVFGMDIEYGPEYSIWVDNTAKDALTFKKEGKTLRVGFTSKHEDYHYGRRMVIITMPRLNNLVCNVPSMESYSNYWSAINVSGFKQQAMKVSIGEFTKVKLSSNMIDSLDALVNGNSAMDSFDDGLTINSNNTIKVANLRTQNNKGFAHIKLFDPKIGRINYDLADSTQLTITGKLLHGLKK